eukprot:2950003-Prymnesium_polylepis.1
MHAHTPLAAQPSSSTRDVPFHPSPRARVPTPVPTAPRERVSRQLTPLMPRYRRHARQWTRCCGTTCCEGRRASRTSTFW